MPPLDTAMALSDKDDAALGVVGFAVIGATALFVVGTASYFCMRSNRARRRKGRLNDQNSMPQLLWSDGSVKAGV